MTLGWFSALRILHRTFRHYPPSARIHILIRYFTCPFTRTLDVIPAGARMMDIGAGHGSYAKLAVEQGAREVIAVEPDLRKSLLPFVDPRVKFVAAFDDAIAGSFDAIVIYDATYRIPIPERHALFRRVYQRLKPGGLFILKDLDPEARLKMKWARFQEAVSDALLGVSIGQGFIYESRSEIESTLAGIGFSDFRARRVDRGYPHSHVIYTARRPA